MKNFVRKHKENVRHFFSNDVLHLSGTLSKKIALAFAALSIAGFTDALYLTIEHYTAKQVNCIVVSGCNNVLQSGYALVFGIPIALLGAVYYFLIFSSVMFFLFGHPEKFFKAAMAFSTAGFLSSLWFISLQLFIIKSICFYCMISAFCSITMFLSAFFLYSRIHRIRRSASQ